MSRLRSRHKGIRRSSVREHTTSGLKKNNKLANSESAKAASDWWDSITVRDSSDQRLIDLLNGMDRVADKLNMSPETRKRAAELVTDSWEQRVLHGRREDAVIGACVYAACRDSKRPRPISTVASATELRNSKLKAAYRTIRTEVGIESGIITPEQYIPYLGTELSLSTDCTVDATDLLGDLDDISGNPVGIAVAALYVVADARDEQLTIRQAAHAAGLAKETVWRQATAIRNK